MKNNLFESIADNASFILSGLFKLALAGVIVYAIFEHQLLIDTVLGLDDMIITGVNDFIDEIMPPPPPVVLYDQ